MGALLQFLTSVSAIPTTEEDSIQKVLDTTLINNQHEIFLKTSHSIMPCSI